MSRSPAALTAQNEVMDGTERGAGAGRRSLHGPRVEIGGERGAEQGARPCEQSFRCEESWGFGGGGDGSAAGVEFPGWRAAADREQRFFCLSRNAR